MRSATKTDTPSLDVAQTVNVVEQELIREQRVIRLHDAVRNVAGVYAAGGEGRRDQFSIRGFSAELDMYVDGIRDPAGYRDFSNIEHVEVLKGPAAMLFGRGSAGGIINRITKKPTAEAVREVQATLGSWDFARAEWDFAGAASAGANYRLTGAYEKGGQFRDEVDNELSTIAGGIEFKLSADTRLLAQFEAQHHERTPDRGVPSLAGQPAAVPTSNFYGEPFDFSTRDTANAGLNLDHDISAATKVKATLRVNTMEFDAVNRRSTGLANANSEVKRNTTRFPKDRECAFAQTELTHRLDLAGSEHLLFGGYEHGRQRADLQVWQVNAPNISLYNPTYTAPAPVFSDASKTYDVSFTGTTDALYLQDQVTFNPRWKAVVGLRHDVFKQEQSAGLVNKVQSAALSRTDRKSSPRAGVIFQPDTQTSWYASAARSFQPKSDDLLFAKASDTNLKPTSATQYEAGNKREFFDGKLAVNAAFYRIVMTDVATADPNNPGQTIQIGEEIHDGVELDLSGEPAPGWRVYGGATWLDPRVTRSNDTPQGNVPRQAANLWLSKQLLAGWRAGLGAYYVGERFAGADKTVRLPAYTRWDAACSYSLTAMELALNLRNITDRTYYESATNNVQIAPGAPR